MKKILLFAFVAGLSVLPMWGQSSGIMPRKSAVPKISTRQMDKPVVDTDPKPIVREGNGDSDSTLYGALRFSPLAVDMLAFDKRMSDTRESFLLRNNTPFRLSRVVLQLFYRDPGGQMIDYRTQAVDCDLLPGTTRKCEIDSFDRSRNYYHVDSPPARVSGRPFVVTYKVLRYDIVVEP